MASMFRATKFVAQHVCFPPANQSIVKFALGRLHRATICEDKIRKKGQHKFNIHAALDVSSHPSAGYDVCFCKLIGVAKSKNNLPKSSHYVHRKNCDFSCLIFGQPKTCNLHPKKLHLKLKMEASR
jgi:hypothetical protein